LSYTPPPVLPVAASHRNLGAAQRQCPATARAPGAACL